jgi:hypothetical protein
VTLRTKKSLNDIRRGNDQAMKNLAALCGKEAPVEALNNLPEKRERAESRDLEGPVLKAVGQLLSVHPRVTLAVRTNSGMAINANGAPVFFVRFVKPRSGMRMPDYIGCMFDGKMLAIECKHPLWKGPRTEHEREQDEFLLAVRAAGGRAGFAVSVDAAQRIITGE